MWRRIFVLTGVFVLLTSAALIVSAFSKSVHDLWGLAGLVGIVPGIILFAIGFVGPSGPEGRPNLWAIFGMGGRQ